MAKNKVTEWVSHVDGQDYQFVYQKIKGGHELEVNGIKQTIKGGFKSSILGFDEGFDLDGIPARFVLEDKEPDVVVGGVYLRSGKNYLPTPAWVMVFALACFALIFLGGVIGAVCGIIGAMVCIGIAKKQLTTFVKVLMCLIVTITTWALYFLIAGVLFVLLF